jgi:hypothetical protein
MGVPFRPLSSPIDSGEDNFQIEIEIGIARQHVPKIPL